MVFYPFASQIMHWSTPIHILPFGSYLMNIVPNIAHTRCILKFPPTDTGQNQFEKHRKVLRTVAPSKPELKIAMETARYIQSLKGVL